MLGSPMLYLKGMRIMMFQLSGFDYIRNTTTLGPATPNFKGDWEIWARGFGS